MEKSYNYSKVFDAIRNDFNPYHALGISENTPDDVILSMWNRYKNRKMVPEIKRAFEMLVIPVNRWVYDRLAEYISNKGKEKFHDGVEQVKFELLGHIASLEDDMVHEAKKDFEDTLDFARHRLTLDDPSTGVEQLEHIARYIQNREGFWFYSKDLKTDGVEAIVDIYKKKDKYIYYIKEPHWEHVIESRYLFIDFNKPTRFDGRLCRLSDVACRIKGNLLGLYTEMNNMDPDIYMKHYYFKNKIGNVYSDGVDRDDAEFKVIDVKKRNVWVPAVFKNFERDNINTILCYVKEFEDYYFNGNDITAHDEEIILNDAIKTNPNDVVELKKIIGRRLI